MGCFKKNLKKLLKTKLCCVKGVSLIAMSFMIMVTGLFIGAGARLYDTWDTYSSVSVTEEKMDVIQNALARYYTENGRYPCPASLSTGIDAAGFGAEVTNDCAGSPVPEAGTQRADGRGGEKVRTGTIPVRTLGLADSYMFDGYKRRFVYAVTEQYAVEGKIVEGDNGAIFVQDSIGEDATASPGNAVQIVYSMGWDENGAFNEDGVLLSACNPALASGENCDFDSDAIFVNTLNKSTNQTNLFVHRMSYAPSKVAMPCVSDGDTNGTPKNTAFIIDTSGSMGWSGLGYDGFEVKCPNSMPGCSRIDVARWAMRRVMPAMIYNNNLLKDPGVTKMTGFAGYGTAQNVTANLGDITFFDPAEYNGDSDGDGTPNSEDIDPLLEAKNQELETELQGMCPSGSTPLGIHIKALADNLGDGVSKDRPNKITILSDGVSNNGNGNGSNDQYDPVAAALYIQSTYPNVQVDIIDMVGNPNLRQVSDLTGGKYYRSDDPDALLKDLYNSAGVCENFTPPTPADQRGCGSRGNW